MTIPIIQRIDSLFISSINNYKYNNIRRNNEEYKMIMIYILMDVQSNLQREDVQNHRLLNVAYKSHHLH